MRPHPDGCTVCAQYAESTDDEKARMRADLDTLVPMSYEMRGTTAYVGGRLHWKEQGLLFHAAARHNFPGDPAVIYPIDLD